MADGREQAMDTPLSAAGLHRKAALRSQLLRELAVRRRWHRGLQGALAAAAIAIAAWAAADGARSAPAVLPPGVRAPVAGVADSVSLTIVRDDPHIVRRLATVAGPPLVEVLRDETLLAMLHTTGRVAGVVRLGEQLVVAGLVADSWR